VFASTAAQPEQAGATVATGLSAGPAGAPAAGALAAVVVDWAAGDPPSPPPPQADRTAEASNANASDPGNDKVRE